MTRIVAIANSNASMLFCGDAAMPSDWIALKATGVAA